MTASRPPLLRLLVPVAVIVGAVLLVLLSGVLEKDLSSGGAETAKRALPVSVLRVDMQDNYLIARGFTGRAVSRRRSELGFETPGRVEAVLVDNGAIVRKDEVIARLDTDRLEAQHKELAAQLAEANANLLVSRKTADRVRSLYSQGHVTEQRLDEASAASDASAAIRASAAAALASVDIALQKSVLRAPYDGMISRRLLDEGTIVNAGTPIVSLIESGPLEAEVGMPLDFAQRLKPGDHVPLKTQMGDLVFAHVQAIVPLVRGETRTALVTLNIDGTAALNIADGSLITAEINDTVSTPGFWLPLRALTADVRGMWRVYKVVGADNGEQHVVFENIQIIHSESDRAFVSGTVNDGDLLIDEGVSRVTPGEKVNIVRIDGVPVVPDGA